MRQAVGSPLFKTGHAAECRTAPLCNGCLHYLKQSPGFCTRLGEPVRITRERAHRFWSDAGRCGPEGRYFAGEVQDAGR